MLPPTIRSRPLHAYDPLPPTTAVSLYDADYFNGVRRTTGTRESPFEAFSQRVMRVIGEDSANWAERIRARWRDVFEIEEGQDVPEAEEQNMVNLVSRSSRRWSGR